MAELLAGITIVKKENKPVQSKSGSQIKLFRYI